MHYPTKRIRRYVCFLLYVLPFGVINHIYCWINRNRGVIRGLYFAVYAICANSKPLKKLATNVCEVEQWLIDFHTAPVRIFKCSVPGVKMHSLTGALP
jgi:hypothetical protein